MEAHSKDTAVNYTPLPQIISAPSLIDLALLLVQILKHGTEIDSNLYIQDHSYKPRKSQKYEEARVGNFGLGQIVSIGKDGYA